MSYEVEFDLQCSECGNPLDATIKDRYHGGPVFVVEVCECIKDRMRILYDRITAVDNLGGYADGTPLQPKLELLISAREYTFLKKGCP